MFGQRKWVFCSRLTVFSGQYMYCTVKMFSFLWEKKRSQIGTVSHTGIWVQGVNRKLKHKLNHELNHKLNPKLNHKLSRKLKRKLKHKLKHKLVNIKF
jgi:hypothetical protein